MPGPLEHQPDERLEQLTGFGSNPGALVARYYVPDDLPAGAPLVVVLHGCTQTASSYNRGAGWTGAADEHGFALLFPEQQRSNNPNLCFNWFSPADNGRGGGEPRSIVQMVEAMCSQHVLDPGRVYVTGLSAGGAMTAVMLATYPEVFAGGASIAGLPFGTAMSVPEAFEQMRGPTALDPDQLSRLVRSASDHRGRWPSLSVWHGSSDQTVDAGNAAALIDQWRGLHAIASMPSTTEKVAGHLRRSWNNSEGVEVIEEYVIADMGHGTPISAASGGGGETAGPYMLDVGISSTRRIVAFWGLDRGRGKPRKAVPGQASKAAEAAKPTPSVSAPPPPGRPLRHGGVREVIEDALRSAGLMRRPGSPPGKSGGGAGK
ncbi:PHB depolymerase family esterase [Sphingomonas sp. LHG3406-1]|uniref:extracellular catalytic domain type 1 short-chain-length polyhydroxyalkanoate depolymerase n=1 Tax=Sphingomonas sp. LHG3406-1 TaxID=2804617 RepID=UPI002607B41A|nr:PHB depolymerase family esterase [Sphingomonas sp. LHG3406-1]